MPLLIDEGIGMCSLTSKVGVFYLGCDVEQAKLLRKLGALKRIFGLLKGTPEEMTTEYFEDKKLKIM